MANAAGKKKNSNRKTECRKIKIYTATNYYINASQSLTEIAKAVDVPHDTLVNWSKTQEWQEALEFWGFTGRKPPARRRAKPGPPEVPYTLTERYLLEKAFQANNEDVRFVTYAGFKDTRVESVDTYNIVFPNGDPLAKHDILLAFPKSRMSDLKRYIKRRKEIADLHLTSIIRRSDRPHIPVRAKVGDIIECVMRNGLVITGNNVWTSKYNIVLRVGSVGRKSRGKVVLIYRHGLYYFKVIEPKPLATVDSQDGWDNE